MNDTVWRRYIDHKFSSKFLVTFFCFAGVLFLVTYFYHQIKSEKYFPISHVSVIGIQHEDSLEIQHLLIPLVDKGFFALDVESIKERLLQQPWISDASVEKNWPNQIVIYVTEKTPIAIWNNNGLMSTTGEIFHPVTSSYPADLPQFQGPEGEQIHVLQYYEKINSLMAPLRFKITRFELLPSHTWSLMLDNGIKIQVGYKDVLTRISHFVKVYPKIVTRGRASEIEYIDLRYPNGLAVRWKTVT
jgi:cell division protein FtsQ